MMRVLFILAAVLVAVLAFVLDQPILNWAAGALLVGGLAALGVHLWRLYTEANQYKGKSDEERRSEELNELGIMEVRPQAAQEDATTDEHASAPPRAEDAPPSAEEPSPERAPAAPDPSGETPSRTSGIVAARIRKDDTASDAAERDAVLVPYLQSLRAALGAQTVALLVQDEMALQYRIKASASQSRRARRAGSFSTSEPLLTATMSRRKVTVRTVGSDGIPLDRLGYYKTTNPVEQVALVPVPSPEETATYFLVADAKGEEQLDAARSRRLLRHYAELLGVLLDTSSPARVRDTTQEKAAAEPEAPDVKADESETRVVEAESSDAPRPRREIVAEEMEAALSEPHPLALALVHLNQAEAIAAHGAQAVTEAEHALQRRLSAAVPDGRVERFGELTFGIFHRRSVAKVEPWAEQFQADMAGATGTLEGGVSIGVAMLDERHGDADAFREDATEALRVAYETGTCTIVE